MKLSKKLLISALALMLGASLVTGCGGQTDAPKDKAQT